MLKRVTGKLFIISLTVSILLHAGFFTGMFFWGDSFDKKPYTDSFLYGATLEYVQILPEKQEKTGLKKEQKTQIRQKQKREEVITEIENTDSSPALETSLKGSATGSFKQPAFSYPGKNDTSSVESLAGYPVNEYKEVNRIISSIKEDEILFKELSDKIHKNTMYPSAARRRGIEGTVIVLFSIDREGCLLKSEIKKSSGYSILDKAALKVIEHSLPHPNLLERQVELKVSIIYTLE
ncbi:MAG: energy transducer TonB [Spirochaetales bacterium]|nr:energy transducer TonB [Spirochaetales bacterium]